MQFHELNVNDKFVIKDQPDIIYTRIQDNRVSCCKVLNATNPQNQQVFIVPASEVTKVN